VTKVQRTGELLARRLRCTVRVGFTYFTIKTQLQALLIGTEYYERAVFATKSACTQPEGQFNPKTLGVGKMGELFSKITTNHGFISDVNK